ncbi:phytanoyl-CoA dioxygenase family protein [Chamaesiphon minutus]|uniref:Phytanoyl-CoA dioxygenase (PhyH) n=1 Tax=Chamaesiphon minutus (strain ATCC 27169 / PCC 6605) TaxID=1173020 RepID=K9UJZ3_CHAP6|nr:phytanoyl-CoA dioxygenase family protein [Chamaesiphon minutus]AFY94519.1 Phytanoyl-CoA dioxygenase (PhyH) [Chamaesiphon minutus PCC 6605]
MDIRLREIEERGFTTIDSYLDPHSIDLLIADITALDLTSGRAGIRNLLELLPSVNKLAHSQEIRSLVEPILGDTTRVVRGIFFDKQPNANWKVPWHQDLSIAVKQHLDLPDYHPRSIKEGIPHVQPPTAILERMLTVRIHLDRTDEWNGALKVIPGSHRHGKLTTPQINEWKQLNRAISCNCQAGGIFLMRPLLLHSSSIAILPSHRRIVHLEYADRQLDNGLEWYY